MAPDPQCSALNAAMHKKGLSYSQIANRLGTSEQHVVDIFTGNKKATKSEFDSIARVLDITSQ
ncbi:hypothetical protein K488DRAFT_15047, partial [Vararia minispora EC-137]